MLIPTKPDEKSSFIEDVIQACEVSQMDRLNTNQNLRNYALFGGDFTAQNIATYNKIWPTVQLLKSFLYAQETVNFSVKFGTGVPKEQAVYGETLRSKVHELWRDTNADQLFGEAVLWSLVNNTCFLKVVYNGGLRCFYCQPHMIGVYREDISSIDNQEAITHLYYTTRSQLRTMMKWKSKEKIDEIMEKITTVGPVDEGIAPQTVTQMILMSQIPNVQGNVNPVWQSRYQYRPQTVPELVEMREVWVYDDELEDYRVFTIASPNVVIMDRKGADLCIKGEHPFIKVTPFPLPDFFWGMSLVQQLIGIQDWHEAHLIRIDQVFRRILDPSRIFSGPGWQLSDEKMMALNRPGGFMNSNNPAGKVETYAPQVQMDQALIYLDKIGSYFDETAGVGANVTRGQGDEGVRSMQHAQILARMGSSRIKQTALLVEDPAEKLATLMMKIQREHDKSKYLDDEGKEFLLSQVTDNFSIKVSGHSLSPVFVEDTKQEAKALLQMKAMTRQRYIDETQPPMAEELKHDLETKIEPSEAQQAKVAQVVQIAKAAKSLGAGK